MKSVLASAMVLALGLAACRVSVETQTRYTRADGDVQASSAETIAAGDKIAVKLIGVEASGIGVSLNGGIVVNAADTDRVSVKARVIGYGYSEDAADAKTAIGNVARSVSVAKNGDTWVVSCTKEKTGDASAGCEYLEVTVPRGTVDAPLSVTIESALGVINANFKNDIVASLVADAKGAGAEIVAQAQVGFGATIDLEADDGPVRLDLPKDVNVDSVRLTGRTEDQASGGEKFSDCSFPGAKFDGTSFTIGTSGQGASLVRLTGETVRLKNPGDS